MDHDPTGPLGQLAPIIKDALGGLPADVVGLAGGDWIKHQRIRNWSRLSQKTEEILSNRGKKSDAQEIRGTILIPVLPGNGGGILRRIA